MARVIDLNNGLLALIEVIFCHDFFLYSDLFAIPFNRFDVSCLPYNRHGKSTACMVDLSGQLVIGLLSHDHMSTQAGLQANTPCRLLAFEITTG